MIDYPCCNPSFLFFDVLLDKLIQVRRVSRISSKERERQPFEDDVDIIFLCTKTCKHRFVQNLSSHFPVLIYNKCYMRSISKQLLNNTEKCIFRRKFAVRSVTDVCTFVHLFVFNLRNHRPHIQTHICRDHTMR